MSNLLRTLGLCFIALTLFLFTPLKDHVIGKSIQHYFANDYQGELSWESFHIHGLTITINNPKILIEKRLFNYLGKSTPLFWKALFSIFNIEIQKAQLNDLLKFDAIISARKGKIEMCDPQGGISRFSWDKTVEIEASQFSIKTALLFLPESIASIEGDVTGSFHLDNSLLSHMECQAIQITTKSGLDLHCDTLSMTHVNDPKNLILHFESDFPLHFSIYWDKKEMSASFNFLGRPMQLFSKLDTAFHGFIESEEKWLIFHADDFNELYFEIKPFAFNYNLTALGVASLEKINSTFSLNYFGNISGKASYSFKEGDYSCQCEVMGGFYPLYPIELKDINALVKIENDHVEIADFQGKVVGLPQWKEGLTFHEGSCCFIVKPDKIYFSELFFNLKEPHLFIHSGCIDYAKEAKEPLLFDFWVSGEVKDLLRLSGTGHFFGKKMVFEMEKDRTRIADLIADTLVVTFDDSEVDSIDFKATCPQSALNDKLQHLTKALSQPLLSTWIKVLTDQPLSSEDLFVDISYRHKQELLQIEVDGNDQIELFAKKEGTLWTLQKVRLSDLELCGQLREADIWPIDFIDIKCGNFFNAKLSGQFHPKEECIHYHCPRVSLDLSFPHSFLLNALEGQWESEAVGTFSAKEGLRATLLDIGLKKRGISIEQINWSAQGFHILGSIGQTLHFDIHKAPYNSDKTEGSLYNKDSFAHFQLYENSNHEIESIHASGPDLHLNIQRQEGTLLGRLEFELQNWYPIIEPLLFQNLDLPISSGTVTLEGSFGWNLGPQFRGKFNSKNIHLNQDEISHIEATVDLENSFLNIHHLELFDDKISLQAEELHIEQDKEMQWLFIASKLKAREFYPHNILEMFSVKNSLHPLLIEEILLDELLATYPLNELSGKGHLKFGQLVGINKPLKFSTSQEELANSFKIDPKWLLPSNGEVDFTLTEDRILLNRFKDFYSEGKGIRFDLAQGEKEAYILWDGTLNISLKLKPHKIPLKWVEMVTLTLKGTFDAPSFNLSARK